MSGGYFDYKQRHIESIISELSAVIDSDFDNPQAKQKLNDGLLVLQAALIYTNRIDYLLSGDDSEQTFLKRLNEDMNNLEDSYDK